MASLISFLKFSQLALAKFGLGGAAIRMGEVEMVSWMGIWSLVVSGPWDMSML